MVRFFFDLAQDGVLSPDDTGLALESAEAAEREALRALAGMARALIGSDGARLDMIVRDESGARLCTVTMTLSVTH
jgi:hypothetical protein